MAKMVCRFVYNLRFAFSPDLERERKGGLDEEKYVILINSISMVFAERGCVHLSTSKHRLKKYE